MDSNTKPEFCFYTVISGSQFIYLIMLVQKTDSEEASVQRE